MKKNHICIFFSMLALGSCQKKPDPVTGNTSTNQLSFQFNNVVNSKPLVLNSGIYTNLNGDSFSVIGYKYYVSNIQLLTDEGKEYLEPNSYHLVDEENAPSKEIIINELPDGNYKQIKFLIGVDSLRNTSGAQTGALDPVHGMFWDWESGYIMTKLEFRDLQSNLFLFHVNGWQGKKSVLRWVTLEFPTTAKISNSSSHKVHINSDIAEWFKTPRIIKFSDLDNMDWPVIADNYSDMFTITKVE